MGPGMAINVAPRASNLARLLLLLHLLLLLLLLLDDPLLLRERGQRGAREDKTENCSP